RRRARLRPCSRRVRRDDHVRGEPARRDADPPARDLRAVLPRLRHRACDGGTARRRERCPAVHPEAEPLVATLSTDFRLARRSFELRLALEVERTVALVGPSGAGKSSVLRVIAGLARPGAGRVALGDEVWTDVERGILASPRSAASASCSRSTLS